MPQARACFYQGNGEFFIGETPRVDPGANDVEIEVAYVGICGTDLHILHGAMDHRITIPQIMGHEASGTVARVGDEVVGLRPGEKVVVRPVLPCGECATCLGGNSHVCPRLRFLGIDGPGALQEYWTVPRSVVHSLAESVPLELGALVEPLAVACHDVRRSGLGKGARAVVIGAGPIGLLISMIVRLIGGEPLILDVNQKRLALAHSLGIPTALSNDVVIPESAEGVDFAFEVSGSADGIRKAAAALGPKGRLVVVGIHPEPRVFDFFSVFWRELDVIGARLYDHTDFETAIGHVVENRLPLRGLITSITDLDGTPSAVADLASGGHNVKSLIQVGGR